MVRSLADRTFQLRRGRAGRPPARACLALSSACLQNAMSSASEKNIIFVSFCHVFHFSRCSISTSRHSFSMGSHSPRVSPCSEFCSHWGYYHCHSEFVPALSAFKRSNLEETFLQVIECCHDSFQNGFIFYFSRDVLKGELRKDQARLNAWP